MFGTSLHLLSQIILSEIEILPGHLYCAAPLPLTSGAPVRAVDRACAEPVAFLGAVGVPGL